jgi:hypothetical protein
VDRLIAFACMVHGRDFALAAKALLKAKLITVDKNR